MRVAAGIANESSVVNYCRVFFENFFRFPVEVAGYLMNLVFSTTAGTSHTNSSARAMYFELFGTFFTFHRLFIRAFAHG